VGDAQTLVADSIAVIATVACLALWLAERHDAGELPAPAPSWRIAENRWSAARDGVEGKMVDLRSGEAIYTRARLHGVLEAIAPFADGLGARDALERAHALVECNGSQRQRTIHRERGPYELARELVEAFLRANGGDTTTT
jgi:carboxylate-amine ligase